MSAKGKHSEEFQNINAKLDTILTSITALEHRIISVENVIGPETVHDAPKIPPKPNSPKFHEQELPNNVYEKVSLPPTVPVREKGKFYRADDLESMWKELKEIQDYLHGKSKFTKTKQSAIQSADRLQKWLKKSE